MELLNALPRYCLFGFEDQDYKKARVVALPIPYDSTVTYKSGSREGPRAIIAASRSIEHYSYELGGDISGVGVFTLDELAPDMSSSENMVNRISKEVGLILDDGKIPLLIGGEHTVTIGALKALSDKGKRVSVIQFDAHTDSRENLFASRYMHATVMARAKELHKDTFHVGIRNIDAESAKRLDRKRILFMSDIHSMTPKQAAKRIIDATGKDVYVTIDLDVLDPSEMPSVGTPEPDGLRFAQLTEMLQEIGKAKNLVGIDVTELCPIPNMHAPDFAAAKLIYLALGYFLAGKKAK